jgi:hypothetical protein
MSAKNGKVDVLLCLLENGADISKGDCRGRSPLFISCVSGELGCVQVLLDHGAHTSEEAVLVAAGNGHHSIVAALVAAGVDVCAEKSYYVSVDGAYNMYEQRQKNAFHRSLFTSGFTIFVLAEWVYLYGWAVLLSPDAARLNPGDINDPIWAIGQTVGLLIMTAADIDINNYLRQNQVRLTLLLLIWGAYYAVLAAFLLFVDQHLGAGIAPYLYAIVVLPFLYIAVSFKKIVEMDTGQRSLTELFTIIMTLDLFSQIGMHFFTGEPVAVAVPTVLFKIGGSVSVMFAYWWSQLKDETASTSFNTAMFAYLFMLGAAYILMDILFLTVMGRYEKNGQWIAGPIHLVPASIMFCFRRSLHRRLGRRWLVRRWDIHQRIDMAGPGNNLVQGFST